MHYNFISMNVEKVIIGMSRVTASKKYCCQDMQLSGFRGPNSLQLLQSPSHFVSDADGRFDLLLNKDVAALDLYLI